MAKNILKVSNFQNIFLLGSISAQFEISSINCDDEDGCTNETTNIEGSGRLNNDDDVFEGHSTSNIFKVTEVKATSTDINLLSINEATHGIKKSSRKITKSPIKKTTQKGNLNFFSKCLI